ncbi:MAG TPA: M14 family metallopeptidase [Gemmatimonadaceae bacterium]
MIEIGRGAAMIAALLLTLGCSAATQSRATTSAAKTSDSRLPRTRAERTSYAETSHYTDVIAFLDSLQALGAPFWRGSIGKTTEGRELPLVVLSRPRVSSPEEAKRLGRPIVYVQGNIHAGEVEGKEALLMLIRDLSFAHGPGILDSVVLLAQPIYNADGNERFASQEKNRRSQNGPEMVGTRANARGLDLNRDYIKVDAPETRASLAAFNEWQPDVFVDLHTTDGSYHGYALTYSPSLNPAAFFGGVYARDSLLPVLRQRMRDRHGFEIFDYGNFQDEFGRGDLTDTVKTGWYTYEPYPRYGTNYFGLRGRISILSEAFSHDPFERRVKSSYAFVREILSLTAERAAEIRVLERRADSSIVAWANDPRHARPIPLRSRMTTHPLEEVVVYEDLVHTGDSSRTQPGVPLGIRRTGHYRSAKMKVYDRFEPTLERRPPAAYVLGAEDTVAVRLLREHGVEVRRLDADRKARVQAFTIDSVVSAQRPFQGHREVRLEGKWNERERTIAAGGWIVPVAQSMGVVAFYMLEPESDDGLVAWNFFDPELTAGQEYPVYRVMDTTP